MEVVETSSPRALGFSAHWEELFAPHAAEGLAPARVIRGDRGSVLVALPDGVIHARPSARLLKSARNSAELPAVGDWVAVLASGEHAGAPLIEAVLPRSSAITRADPGGTSDVQVLAANIDTVFVVHPIAEPPNLRRIERELSVAWDSGASPVVLLTKADLSADPDEARTAVEAVALGAPVLVTNALAGDGMEPILGFLSDHRTAVLVGPSGAGKSTIINALLGEERQATHPVRVSDGRGVHTTVARELFQMPGGGVLIDTPGLRAFGLTGSEEGIASVFPEIARFQGSCHFRDCAHDGEPGCAVQAAVDSGEIPSERLASYHKLMKEARDRTAQAEALARTEEDRASRTGRKAPKNRRN
jgi:ribosome biogenesis GTPase / thiamine phosphate phosphatase